MAQTVCVLLGPDERSRLAIARDRRRPVKHGSAPASYLFSAERLPVLVLARGAGVSGLALAAALRRLPAARA